ncbi:MAG TPA: phosphoesterase [Acidobacteriaceae bacterium]|jgi:DNA-binding beta-propeller fold protein YncE
MPLHRRTTLVAALPYVLGIGHFSNSSASFAQESPSQRIDLPTSKQLFVPAPGDPRRVNSLPLSLAVSPDGKWVVSLNAGYGTVESNYMQSLSVLNTSTGGVQDVPDDRTPLDAPQTFYSGLAFSADGTHLYASLASTTNPEGDGAEATGNGVAVFGFRDGTLKRERLLKLPLVSLPPGKTTALRPADGGRNGIPFPAAIAVIPGAQERLLVAENLSDSVAVVNPAAGTVQQTFDLSVGPDVPSTYPIALAVSADASRAFVALWNASEVVELDLLHGTVVRRVELMKGHSPTAPGSHPCALLLDERAGVLYVALANRDAVAALRVSGKHHKPELSVAGYFDTRLPGQSYFGAEPDALAENADGTQLYAANLGSDAVAVIDPHRLTPLGDALGMTEPIGFVPTELMPTALAFSGETLYVATDKGKGTGPNNMPQAPSKDTQHAGAPRRSFTYSPTLIHGSLASLGEKLIRENLKSSTEDVLESNRMRAAESGVAFASGHNPITHVIYIIKENRTYDQILGDLENGGRPVGNGDQKLTMYGESITPNEHKLALQFGVLDNFFDSGEVSGEGHVWSTAAIGTDYLEKTWQISYRGRQRTYDYEGMVADGYPLLQHIPDVNEPATSYIWSDLAAHGKSIYHFAEYVSSIFCGEPLAVERARQARAADPRQGAMSGGETVCPSSDIKPGQPLPPEWGGGTNLWPWAIPRLAANIATKPELVGNFAPESPDFNLRVPDQIRVNVFLGHLEQWKKDRAAGHDTMPNFILLRLPNDHTAGTTPGGPTPRSSVADNDLAVGRAVEAISHSAFWDDTAFFILEDDAQNGGDHVDAHRSIALVVSKYAPHPKADASAVVDSRFYSTVSVLRTIEALLGVPPMNNNDAFASLISTLFTGPGDQPPYDADYSNRDNRLIYTANQTNAVGAAASMKMDFTHADRAPADKLNLILWQDARGAQPPPAILLQKHPKHKDDDDD